MNEYIPGLERELTAAARRRARRRRLPFVRWLSGSVRTRTGALALAGALLLSGSAVAVIGSDSDGKPGVPASACPEAKAVVERHGESVDRFIIAENPDGCPDPEDVDRELGKPGDHYPIPRKELIETCEEAPEVARGNGLCQKLGAGQ